MTLEADVQQGWHDAIVEMFDLDLTPITGDVDDKFYFTNQLKPDNTKIQWKGNVYEPLPILSTGYEKSTTGQIAQPSLTVANVMGTFTQVIDSLDDLVGAKVTRRRTLGKYLDGEPGADTTQEFPIDIFYIERKTAENALSITWQLASVLDLEGLKLPRRVITQNYCQWKYRSSECSYTGAPVFTVDDGLVSAAGQSTEALAVINAYAFMKQKENELEAAIAAKNAAAATKEAKCNGFSLLETQFNLPGSPGAVYYVAVSSDAFGSPGSGAQWNGVAVTIGDVYRQGPLQATLGDTKYYSIERWGVDAAGCSAATSALAAAEASLTTVTNNYNSSIAALNAATAALPVNDALWRQDVCGKRVSSCRLRFPSSPLGSQSLPFGGFPGAIRGRQ